MSKYSICWCQYALRVHDLCECVLKSMSLSCDECCELALRLTAVAPARSWEGASWACAGRWLMLCCPVCRNDSAGRHDAGDARHAGDAHARDAHVPRHDDAPALPVIGAPPALDALPPRILMTSQTLPSAETPPVRLFIYVTTMF